MFVKFTNEPRYKQITPQSKQSEYFKKSAVKLLNYENASKSIRD